MRFRFETWTSTENEEETHIFIEGTATYVFGYNPQYLTKVQAMAILDAIEAVKQ